MSVNFRECNLLHTVGLPEQLPKVLALPVPHIALSGRSNVGKSSLINAIIERKSLARTSSSPGKTVTINFYGVQGPKKGAIGLYLVDLPGYGFAKRSPEEKERFRALTDGYFTGGAGGRIALVLQLVDLGVGPTADDLLMLDFLSQTLTPHIIIATKADKLNKEERRTALAALKEQSGASIIVHSAKSGEGNAEVIAAIKKAINR